MKICFADLEADNLLPLVTVTWCGVFKDANTKEVTRFRPHEIKQMLEFMDTIDVLIMHNGIGYDWPMLEKLYGYVYRGTKVDTLIMSRLLNPKRLVPFNCPNKRAGPNSIEAWGWKVGRGKPEHNDWSQFTEEMMHRCEEDVEILALVYEELLKESKGGKWKNAFKLSFRLFENLQKQEAHGWLVDRPHMDKCIRQLTKWIERIDKVIVPKLPMILEVEETKTKGEYSYVKKPFLKSGEYSESSNRFCIANGLDPKLRPIGGCFTRVSFRPTDLNSGNETKAYLLESGWEPLVYNTDSEGNQTSPQLSKDDPFEGVNGKLGKLVAKRVQIRQRRSIIEGLLELIRPDGRISARINTLAVTGRATHRGIVNIPRPRSFYGKQLRQIFIAKPGFVIVGTDSDSCQLRMLASRMGSEAYIDALVNGDKKLATDNHSLTMRICDLDSRDTAKTTMYCLLFGGGDTKLGKSAKKPGQGAEVRKALYKGLDGLEQLVYDLTKEWRSTARQKYNDKFKRMEYFNGSIAGLDGRPIRIPSEHQLLVYMLQSDESLMMSVAYNFAVSRLSRKYIYGEDFGVVAWIHDEIQVECRAAIAEDVGKTVAECITKAGEFFKMKCPHIGDYSIGKSWFDTH